MRTSRTKLTLILGMFVILIGAALLIGNPIADSLALFTPLYGEVLFDYDDLHLYLNQNLNIEQSDQGVLVHPVDSEAYPAMLISKLVLDEDPADHLEEEEFIQSLVDTAMELLPLQGWLNVSDVEQTAHEDTLLFKTEWELHADRKEYRNQNLQSNKFKGATLLVPSGLEVYVLHFTTYEQDLNDYLLEDLMNSLVLGPLQEAEG